MDFPVWHIKLSNYTSFQLEWHRFTKSISVSVGIDMWSGVV